MASELFESDEFFRSTWINDKKFLNSFETATELILDLEKWMCEFSIYFDYFDIKKYFQFKNTSYPVTINYFLWLNYWATIFWLATSSKLGDSWNYILPIVVTSSGKLIRMQILVIAKLNGRKNLIIRGCVFEMILPGKKLFKVSNLITKIRCENCSRLQMKTLERRQWRSVRCFYC